jgi:hypothetical protein
MAVTDGLPIDFGIGYNDGANGNVIAHDCQFSSSNDAWFANSKKGTDVSVAMHRHGHLHCKLCHMQGDAPVWRLWISPHRCIRHCTAQNRCSQSRSLVYEKFSILCMIEYLFEFATWPEGAWRCDRGKTSVGRTNRAYFR